MSGSLEQSGGKPAGEGKPAHSQRRLGGRSLPRRRV
jgi:hypothetical protein